MHFDFECWVLSQVALQKDTDTLLQSEHSTDSQCFFYITYMDNRGYLYNILNEIVLII